MNKTLVIGDVHLNEVHRDYFLCVLFPFLEQVHSQRRYNRVLFLGDVFDASNLTNSVAKLFKQLISIYSDIEIVILNGNHDKISKSESIYDILMLPDNVTVHKDVAFVDNQIFIPHIDKSVDQHEVFLQINNYIKSNKLSRVLLYSHNDFNEIYKFKNNFFNIAEAFKDVTAKSYLINGHNHVPIFKNYDNLSILNIGCALNTNFNDSGLFNYFMIIDHDNDKFEFFKNKYSIQYHTFHIWKEDNIYEQCKHLNNVNYSYIKFKIHDPTIVIDNNLKNRLYSSYNIVDILVDYEIHDVLNITAPNKEDSTSITDLLKTLNISIEEFNVADNVADMEKMEILLSLLNIMFETRETSSVDIEKVINTVKKYIL